jgi:ABC-2 type transport system ATP-binding protein
MTAETAVGAPASTASSTGAAVLEVDGLVKRYGEVTAVNGVSFQIEAGEIFGLLGPNGAGKTTTISVIATLLKPDGGSVRVAGHDARRDAMGVRRSVGYVPQEVGLYNPMTAVQNLEYFGRLYGLWGRALRQRVDEVLEVVGLTEAARKPRVAKFSGGMRRRLNLACGLLHRPKLLLLDEPTVGVDPQSRNHIFESIQALCQEHGTAILYTTHYVEEAEALCRLVAIMDHGEIIACDDVPRLLSSLSGVVFRVQLAEEAPAFEPAVRAQPGVLEVTSIERNGYQVMAAGQEQGLAALLSAAQEHRVTIEGLDISTPSLEQLFLKLTGKALRD